MLDRIDVQHQPSTDRQQRVPRHYGADQGSTVAQKSNKLPTGRQLEHVVDRVTEAMGPMEERERNEGHQIQACDGMDS